MTTPLAQRFDHRPAPCPMRTLRLLRSSLIPLALVSALAPGCALAVLGAGAGAGYVITRELEDGDGLEAEVQEDVDVVWIAAIESLDILHDLNTDVVLQDFPREARAVVDGRDVSVTVDAYDLDRTILRVRARTALAPDEELERQLLDDIVGRLER